MRTPIAILAGTLAFSCSEKSLNVLSEPPVVTVQEPSDGSSFYTGQTILFKALVKTTDGEELTNVTHQWVSGSETICLSAPVPADGYATCSWAYDQVGTNTVTVTVTDPRLASATASVSVNIVENTSPTVEIVQPTPDQVFAVDDLIVFEGLVDDVEESSENILVSVSSSNDGDLGLEANATSSGQFTGATYLTPGEHLITMMAEDSYGRTAQDTLTLTVFDHGPPEIESVGINPPSPDTEDDLAADVQGWTDLEGSAERNRYRWFIGDSPKTIAEDITETTATYPAAKTTKGDLVRVEVTPYNDYGDGATVSSATIEILNAPPSAPLVTIEPSNPEPDESLYCYASDSEDADGDPVAYQYAWNQNGFPSAVTTNVVPADLTANGDTWECVVTPDDGEDSGSSGSDYVTVSDTVSPNAPVIDTPSAYRNDDEVTLTGTCEPGCDLTFYCYDDLTTWTDLATCNGVGLFSYTTSLNPGYTSSCYAECTDSAGNTSPYSNTVSTQVCDPSDGYELTSGVYGDGGPNAINEWSALRDDGSTTIAIQGNILDDDDEDWYVISTLDNVSEDFVQGIDYYNFAVDMVDGTSTYAISVYAGSYDATDLECGTTYTEYNDYTADRGDGGHGIPSDARYCAAGSPYYNTCEDDSQIYYVQVVRNSSSVTSCQGYELEITNGVW